MTPGAHWGVRERRSGHRPGRRSRWLLAVALVLAAVVVAAALALPGLDRRARQAAAAAVAEQVQRELGLAQPPTVTIRGRWFLLQALRGRYPEGWVSAPVVTAQGASARDVHVQLYDVRVPPGVLLGRGGAVDVGSGTARALVPWAEVEARASASAGRPVALARDGTGVRASTTVTVLRREVDLALTATPEVGDRSLRLRPERVSVAGREVAVDDARSLLGRAGLDPVAELLDGVDVGLEQVPPQVRLHGVRVSADGVVVLADLAPLTFPVTSQ